MNLKPLEFIPLEIYDATSWNRDSQLPTLNLHVYPYIKYERTYNNNSKQNDKQIVFTN